MSYARWSEGDVYIYSTGRVLRCDNEGFETTSRAEMIAHVEGHVAQGAIVPDRCVSRLREEIGSVGDAVHPSQWGE